MNNNSLNIIDKFTILCKTEYFDKDILTSGNGELFQKILLFTSGVKANKLLFLTFLLK